MARPGAVGRCSKVRVLIPYDTRGRKRGSSRRGIGMQRTARILCSLVCLVIAFSVAGGQATRGNTPKGPSSFAPDGEDSGLENAQPPSDAVLDALLKTSEANEAKDDLAVLSRDQMRDLFKVVKVHLKGAVEADYVVLGSGPLSGADCFWFWIVRERQGKAKVLLFENPLKLELSKRRTNGYRDIRSSWCSAAFCHDRLFRYSADRYRLVYQHDTESR